MTYDDEYLHQRSKMIQWAISARSQYSCNYPDEEPYQALKLRLISELPAEPSTLPEP